MCVCECVCVCACVRACVRACVCQRELGGVGEREGGRETLGEGEREREVGR